MTKDGNPDRLQPLICHISIHNNQYAHIRSDFQTIENYSEVSFVIPVKTGIQLSLGLLDTRLRGHDGFWVNERLFQKPAKGTGERC